MEEHQDLVVEQEPEQSWRTCQEVLDSAECSKQDHLTEMDARI
jgi:hypothetical protein